MKNVLRVQLQTDEAQTQRLRELQQAFATVCNALSPLAQRTRCWNRVALHHMAYKQLRQQFPGLGSQMVCNAIYSVSRACRQIYQSPGSPFNLQRLGTRPLPLVQFSAQAPVYFDRHTLSIKDGQVSLFTLDGRMRFQLPLSEENEARFRTEKLREIVLTSQGNTAPSKGSPAPAAGGQGTARPWGPSQADKFFLAFSFAEGTQDDDEQPHSAPSPDLPEYMLIIEDPDTTPLPVPPTFQPRLDAVQPQP